MNRPLKAALVALLGLSASLGTGHAQATASYSAGDLLLGFRASDGTGATKNYVVNLGSADTLSSLTGPKLFGADGTIAADLVALFGADWNTRADVFWSVSGTAGSFAPVGTIPAKTLFATFPESTPGTYETTVWVRGSSTAQGVVTSKMNGFATAFKSYTPSANNPVGVIQNQTDTNSYGSYQKGGTLPNSGPSPGISFAYFNPSIEASFASGASASTLDLVKLEPATSEFVGTQGTILGRFAISTSGTITFTPKPTGVPPVIASQPQSTGINAGGSALLSVSATTPEGVTYQWSKDGSPISGATSSSYLATTTGSYTVTLTTSGGSVTSQAAVVSTSTLGQLYLGFRATDGTGATKNYLVKLGSASNFTNGSSAASFGTDGSIAKDLADLFGSNWSTRSDLFWSVSGTTGSFDSVGGLPAKTLFASIAELTPGTFETTRVWARSSSTAQGIVTSKMNSLSTAFASYSASSNNPLGVIQNQTDANSYGSFQKGGTLVNSGPSPGISFAYFNPTIEADFQSGAANSVLDLVQIEPGSGDAIGTAGTVLGRLRISPSGVVDFIPKNTVEVTPLITAQPTAPSGGALPSGSSATLAVTATGTGLSYQWRKDGSVLAGATSSSYTATAPGTYSVVVTNSVGSTTSSDIVLTGPPVIASQPSSTGLNTGGSALLTVAATVSQGVTYQWSKDGSPITGATSSSFLATTTGSYTVSLTNIAGSVTSQAAVVSTSTLGQLFLGFRAADGTGATKNYLVKLGSASNFTNGTSVVSFGTDGSLAKDLADLFGADWSTRSDVYWSVSGTTGSFQSVGGVPAKTLFASIAEATPGTFETSRLWVRASSTAQGIVTSKMNSLSSAFASYSASPNNPLGVIQNQTDANSYGSFQKGGTLVNSGPSPGISFAYFNPSIEANFQSGAANSVLDLVQLEPGSGDTIGAAGTLLGRFRISASGVVAFIPKNTAEVAPSITTQPLASATITFGGSKTLNVTAANAESAAFQWFKNGSPIANATSASFIANEPGSYTVSVSSVFGSVTSNAAKVSVTGNQASIEPTGVLAGTVKGSVSLAGAEIPAFDPLSKRAFASSSTGVQVVDLTSPSNPTFLSTIAPASLGVAGLTSNDVSSINVRKGANGNPSVLAIAVINSPKTNLGHVVFVRADTGALLGAVQVGANPDHVTFTPDGTKVLVANEGELDGTAATIPDSADGSVSIIDVSAGFTSPSVKTAGFSAWDSSSSIAQLRAAGVRIFENGIPSKDFEPEYIGVSPDSTKAFVTLQEANAIGILDLVTGAFTDVVPLGKKDFSTGFHDFSDKDGVGGATLINLTTGNPVKGLYMPDAVASFTSQGKTYYVIANEGDDRNDFLTPDETTTVGNASYVLDPTVFPNGSALKQLSSLGRLVVSNASGLRGDIDGDGDIDEILSYGGRSFSILDAQGNMVFDSGDMIERIVSTKFASSFDDTRSDNKGPEPEGVTVATIGGVPYAFVGLERSSLMLVFDVSNPLQPAFVNGIKRTGDTSPEGLMVVSEADAPEGKPLLLVTNEVSNTLSVFELGAAQVSIGNASIAEGDSATKSLNLVVTRSSNATAFSVNYAVSGGTATAGTDYTLANGTLTFTAGGPDTQNITLTINGDTSVENDETITVSLSSVVNTTGQTVIGTATGTATIVNDDIIPVITAQPTGPVGGVIQTGGSATLTVTATGSGISYQWRKDGSNIAGATSASYTATAPGTYTVVVTNAAGSVTSTEIIIGSAITPPVITLQPSGGTLPESGQLTLTVAATGTDPVYQWRRGSSVIAGANGTSYTAFVTGSYSVTITNSSGSVTSQSAVIAPPAGPTITQNPVGGALTSTGSITLSVTATGSGLSYQWRKDGGDIAGATSANYAASAAGVYSVVITNAGGAVLSSSATVTKAPVNLATLSGEFQGLLTPTSVSDRSLHGLITATVGKPVGKNQSFAMVSGKVNRASGSQSFIGKVDASGNVSFTTNNLPWLTVSGTNGVQLTLEVSNSSNGLTLQGKLRQSGSEVATTTARKTVAPTTSQKGRYTAAFQQVEGQSGSYPEGDGHATAFVSSASIAFIGRLADGSSASASMKLTESGAAPLFSPVYSGKGLISGAMTFAAGQDGTDASAIGVRWFRSANVTYPAGYRDGWPTGILVDLLAYKYVGTNGFGIANTGTTGLALKFLAEGGNLQSALNGSVSLSSKNVLTASPGTVKLTTTLNSATGIITGTFTTPNTTTPTKFSAVILQKTRLATGFFLNGAGTQAKSGVIQITE